MSTACSPALLVLALALAPAAACGDSGGGTDATTADTTTTDTTTTDATATDATATDATTTDDTATTDDATAADTTTDDATTADTTVEDTTPTDTSDEDVPTHIDDLGFAIRVPQVRSVPAEDFGGQPGFQDVTDIDHVCKVVADGLDGYLYVQGNAVSCAAWGGCQFTVPAAWLKVGSDITRLDGVVYDYGGNHHNDWITLPHGAHSLKLYHSSFGFGWRSCHTPDCAQVYDGDTVTTDGCTTDRTLPVVCVKIAEDGTEPPLVDDFAKCLGDPNAR